jgi:hypothetical protein
MYHKITPNQIKKHVSQLTENELSLLQIIVSNLQYQELYLSNHSYSHIPNLTLDEVYYTLSDCSIIEFNITNGDSPRLLVRANNPTHCRIVDGIEIDYNMCMVIELKSHTVISVFCNECTDIHDSLDPRRYDASINVVEIAQSLN